MKVKIKDIFSWGFIAVVVLFTLIPMMWLLSTSLKMRKDINAGPPSLIPTNPTLQNYKSLYGSGTVEQDVGRSGGMNALKNSLIVATFSTILALMIGFPAAYAFARYKNSMSKNLSLWLLSTRMFPPAAIIIPLFILFLTFKLIDTKIALIITYLVYNLPFVVWMLKTFIAEIPYEIEESALVDGCSRFRIIWSIIFPLAAPGIVSTGILSFIFSWNEFLFALVLARIDAQTFPVFVAGYIGTAGISWGEMSAYGMLGVIPIFIFLIFVRKHLLRGLAFGSIKGTGRV